MYIILSYLFRPNYSPISFTRYSVKIFTNTMSEMNGLPSTTPSATSITVTQNSIVQPLLTDLYQITMAYSYWKSGKTEDRAVFDLFFRKSPFKGEFTIFAGLEECIKFVSQFKYSRSDIDYIKQTLPRSVEPEFYKFLARLDAKNLIIYAAKEGSIVFPSEPLLRVEGPLIVVQLLETTLLNLVNYASLITTNAARYRIAAGKVKLLEFGLRRAQGPDGGLSASKYSYMGGFDGTSNVLAGKLFNIPVKGTHAHAYVTSFSNLSEVRGKKLVPNNNSGAPVDFTELAMKWREKLSPLFKVVMSESNDGEFAAFISFALAFPTAFVALVDTYDVIRSGLLNFSAVAMALHDLGYKAVGIRLDSGDLAYLSKVARERFRMMASKFERPDVATFVIMASNDLTDDTIVSLNDQAHEIDTFAIGTHLVTCQKQPALGCVYKMVEINGHPKMKLSHDVAKVSLPGRKDVFRLYGEVGYALIDIMQRDSEGEPQVGERVLCRHPFQESKRAYVTPTRVESLLELFWDKGEIRQPLPSIDEIRERVQDGLKLLRPDIKRNLNPTPYKVSVSDELYHYLHELWLENAPIGELL